MQYKNTKNSSQSQVFENKKTRRGHVGDLKTNLTRRSYAIQKY
jgi:hypothetical protein